MSGRYGYLPQEEPPAYLSQSTERKKRKEPPRGEDGKYAVDFMIPLDNRVIVFPDVPEGVTEGGILLPETAQEKPRKGTVVAVGPGKLCEYMVDARHKMMVKQGDRVFFTLYSGADVTFDDVVYRIMTEAEIICVLKPEDAEQVDMGQMKWYERRKDT